MQRRFRHQIQKGISGVRGKARPGLTEGLCAGTFLSMLLMTAFHSAEYSTGRGGVVPLVIFWMSPCIVARVEIPVSRVQVFSRAQSDILYGFLVEERQRRKVT